MQAACAEICCSPDRAEHPSRLLDGLERSGPSSPSRGKDEAQPVSGDHRGRAARPSHGPCRADRRPAWYARVGRIVFHLLQREQLHDLGHAQDVPRAWLALQGPRRDAVVWALWHRHLPARDCYRRICRAYASQHLSLFPAAEQKRRVVAGVDNDAVDTDQQHGCRGASRPALPPHRARSASVLGR